MVDPETAASVFLGDSPQVPSDGSGLGKIILESTLTGLLHGSVTAGQGPSTVPSPNSILGDKGPVSWITVPGTHLGHLE